MTASPHLGVLLDSGDPLTVRTCETDYIPLCIKAGSLATK